MNVKITVLRTELYEEIAEEYLSEGKSVGVCPVLKRGDTFLYESEREAEQPDGFCPWAWVDLYPAISRMSIERVPRKEGESYWYKYEDKSIVCCSDGVRPVIFLLERMKVG